MTQHRLQEYWTEADQSLDGGSAFSADNLHSSSNEKTDDIITRSVKTIEQFLGAHPRLTVAAAVTFGITLGWLVKRK